VGGFGGAISSISLSLMSEIPRVTSMLMVTI
jgi:hypothetical protein